MRLGPVTDMNGRLLPKITCNVLQQLARLELESIKLTDYGGLQVNKDGSGNVLPTAGFTEEGANGVAVSSGIEAVRLDAVL